MPDLSHIDFQKVCRILQGIQSGTLHVDSKEAKESLTTARDLILTLETVWVIHKHLPKEGV